jgi:hypothetical protein
MNVSNNRGAASHANKSNNLDDDEEFHNDDNSDEDKVSDNKERNKFKKSITQKTAKGRGVDIPNMVDSS